MKKPGICQAFFMRVCKNARQRASAVTLRQQIRYNAGTFHFPDRQT